MILSKYPGALNALFPVWDLDSIQALGFDAAGGLLSCDGKEGPLTRSGDFLVPSGDELPIVRAALTLVREGVREQGKNNHGPDVIRMYGGDRAKEGWAWCAATVSTAILAARVVPGFSRISGAKRLTDWFDARGLRVRSVATIAAGDIISWTVPSSRPYTGHVGIVCHVEGDAVYVIEGNGGAPLGRVRVYQYSLKAGLVYGRGKHPVWKVVRPA